MSLRLRLLGGALLVTALALPVLPAVAHADDGKGTGTARALTARQAAASAALAKAESAFAVSPSGDPSRSATLALRDLRVAQDDLPAAERAAAKVLLARPVGAQVACSADTCVHFVISGADAVALTDDTGPEGLPNGFPDYVDTVLATVDDVRQTYLDAGYRAPLSDLDSLSNGGDGRLDVYLEDLVNAEESLYGYCASDDPFDGPGFDVSAYCALDNDFSVAEFGAPPLDSLRVTVAHEYFHAVQFAYDYLEDGWFMEGTATWMEEQLFDAINDNRQYLSSSPLSLPTRALDRFGGYFHYGAWIFFGYLGERMTASLGGVPTLLRDVWNYADASAGAPDLYSTQAIDRVLRNRGTSLASQFARFSVANRSPRTWYSEGAAYRTAPATNVAVTATRRNPAAAARTLDHLTSSTIRYTPSRLTASNWRLKLAFNLAPTSRGSMAAVTVFRRNGSVSTTYVGLNSQGDAVVRVPFSSASVNRVEVTLVNASRRFTNCWDFDYSPYSCYGYPVDENLRQVVDPLAYRG